MSLTGDSTDWLHLAEGEDVLWSARPHPIELGTRFLVGLAFAVFGLVAAAWAWEGGYGLVGWLGIAIAAGGVASAGVSYAFWTNTRYVLTNEQLYAKRGVVSRDVTQLSLERVQNTTRRQSVAGRLLGYGDISVYTAGSGEPEVTFDRVPDPERASRVLSRQLGRANGPNRTSRV
ncbi:PH domain-containing protein [Halovivax gelatinilyticus]|uniref:PH domain-containing protein n=1 Tax=Halovivax gelatinilyticus TaxID=2961597 RepID=UPI0020CA7E25|nr:PH domain-containing protein [Halovivax gelatinilyticus]